MSIIQIAYRLQFYYYLPIADKVCFVSLLQLHTVIHYLQLFLTLVWNALTLKFNLQSLLIDRFKETMSKVIIHLESSPNNFITLFLVDNHSEAIIREIREIRVR